MRRRSAITGLCCTAAAAAAAAVVDRVGSSARYVASQGTALGRAGRVHVSAEADTVWVGGDSLTCIEGQLNV